VFQLLSVWALLGSLHAGEALSHLWPQAAGPNGTWCDSTAVAPVRWSVTQNEHIRWRTPLPNGGQGGIAVATKTIFLATFPEQDEKAKRMNNTVLGHALDRATGKWLWSVTLSGGRPSPQLYAFSDSTSWSPICDDQHVWFFNSSGEMGCWDHSGKEIWRRQFRTQPDRYPFNRQCEPILFGDVLITVEPKGKDEPGYDATKDDWNYLHAIDRMTGKVRWIAADACTSYCTPCFGHLPDGRPAVLQSRGGPHGVPETPIGLTMTSLAAGEEGSTVWRFTPEAMAGAPLDGTTYMALYNNVWDSSYAYWFRHAPEESHLVIDIKTGKLVREQSLVQHVDVRPWDKDRLKYSVHMDVLLRDVPDPAYPLKAGEVLHVLPQWHTNAVANGYHWFLCSTNNRRNGHAPKGHSGPSHCLGRVAIETGKVEYLELPVGVERKPGAPDTFIYGRSLRTKPLDNQGRDVAAEDRSRTDGWEINAFFPTPIVLGDKLYISVLLGLTYVIDTKAAVLSEKALIAVNDLGPIGETWSLSGPSYADGILYHRSVKEVVAVDGK
jgi:outer membrane protein assembly factor BamB